MIKSSEVRRKLEKGLAILIKNIAIKPLLFGVVFSLKKYLIFI